MQKIYQKPRRRTRLSLLKKGLANVEIVIKKGWKDVYKSKSVENKKISKDQANKTY